MGVDPSLRERLAAHEALRCGSCGLTIEGEVGLLRDPETNRLGFYHLRTCADDAAMRYAQATLEGVVPLVETVGRSDAYRLFERSRPN